MQTQTFNISLPTELVKRADEVAKKEYRNRSELIKEALRTYLRDKEVWDDLFSYGKKIGTKIGIKNEEDVYRLLADAKKVKRSVKSSD